MIAGRKLRFPIYGAGGELLLAAGVTITPRFAEQLRQRSIQAVRVHQDDLAQAVLQPSTRAPAREVEIDAGIAERIDSIIDDGLLFVTNSEPAVMSQMIHHGRTSYNRQKFLDRINRNKETSGFVDDLMRNALNGRPVDGGQVTRLTAQFLNDITGDIDATVASALDTVRQTGIANHAIKSTLLAMAMGVTLGLDAPNVRTLGLAGLVHDWGMARVPEEIRNADRWLTDDERYEIWKHPIYSLRLLEKTYGVSPVVSLIAYQVHERPNGTGYPQGRTAERIHLMASILGVADAYCALVSPRPFRPPLIPHDAVKCLLLHSSVGNHDPRAVRALLAVQSLFPLGSYVTVSDGSVARVLRSNGDQYARPIVRLVHDKDGKEVPEDSDHAIVDLAVDGLEVVQALPSPGSHARRLTRGILDMRPG